MIELRQLTKTYPMENGRVEALRRIDLNVDEGEFVAVVGSSGSGKSTLLNMLGLLDTWDSGAYRLNGEDVSNLSEGRRARARNRSIGFVFQSFHLLPTKRAWENVALPLTYAGTPRRDRRARAMALLDRLGLADRTDHLPSELSGGQRQRVAIARALVTDPPLILADEPTGNLDSKTTDDVLKLLEEIHREGRTVVVVTHEEEVAQRAARRIVMQDAEIVRDDGREGQKSDRPEESG
ncbi:MAG: ABC transporter ATP-binding protein [Myxococcota bacterium]